MADCDIEPAVAEWVDVYRRNHRLMPSFMCAAPRVRAPERVRSEYGMAHGITVHISGRHEHTAEGARSWSVFLDYCTRVKGYFPMNPMEVLEKPELRKVPIQSCELDTVRRIVDTQPDPAR